MTGRPSVGLDDLEEISRRIAEGRFSNRPGCTLEVSTYAYVLETGRVMMSGTAQAIGSDDAIRRSYLGY